MSTALNKLPDADQAAISFFDAGIFLTIVMVVVAFALAFIVFGLTDLIKFPKNAIKIGGGILFIGVIFFILYTTSSFDNTGRLVGLNAKFDITENISKFISGGIKTTLGLLGFSVVAVVLGEIWSQFK